MRLTHHVTPNFNSSMSTARTFLDTEIDFDTTWHSGMLHKSSRSGFSAITYSSLSTIDHCWSRCRDRIVAHPSYIDTQAYQLFSLEQKNQCFDWRRDVNAMQNVSRGTIGSALSPTCNALPANHRRLPSPLYSWHIWDRSKRGSITGPYPEPD
jgi:hypothetical protein